MIGGSFNIVKDKLTGLLKFENMNNTGMTEINVIKALFQPYFGSFENEQVVDQVIKHISMDPYSNKFGKITELNLILHNYQNNWHENSDFVKFFNK